MTDAVFPGPIPLKLAVVIPAHNEAEAIGGTIAEIRRALDRIPFETPPVIAVGDNASTDGAAALARKAGALTGATSRRGYGWGCEAAMNAVRESGGADAFLFMAADGANDPSDIEKILWVQRRTGADLVLGQRTRPAGLAPGMSASQWIANRALGFFCGLLCGRFYRDLGPFRLVLREAMDKMELREMEYGWTIEQQIAAPALGLKTAEIWTTERKRRAGEQKISGVSWRKTFSVGLAIFQAGLRTRRRMRGPKSNGPENLSGPQ